MVLTVFKRWVLLGGLLVLVCTNSLLGEANNGISTSPMPNGPYTMPPAISGTPAIVALPSAERTDPPKGVDTSPTPYLHPSALNAFVFNGSASLDKVSTLVETIQPVCPKNKSYQGQTSSGKFLLSLCVLCYVLKHGPSPEYQALEIPKAASSNALNPDAKITVSEALRIAAADFNHLAKEIYILQPELLETQPKFVTTARELLVSLRDAEKKFNRGSPKF